MCPQSYLVGRMKRMSKKFDLADFDEQARLERDNLAAATEEAVAVFKKHYPNERMNMTAPQVLAACIEQFDLTDPKDAGQLYLEWTVEQYVGRKVEANLDDIRALVVWLQHGGFFEDSPYEYNDGDYKLFNIPHDNLLIFCAKGQSLRYIYILEDHKVLGSRKLHIRQYYDEYDFDGEKDKWQRREEKKYTEGGIRTAIKKAFWLGEGWSDCIEGNSYPQRPNLKYFKDRNFDPQYGDGRDIGYVLSYDNFVRSSADSAIHFFPEVKDAFFYLRCAVGEMTR
jgi:hypothetical protein